MKNSRKCNSLSRLPVLLFLSFLIGQPLESVSQIPVKAVRMADSISQTRLLCPGTRRLLQDSIYYPKTETAYQSRKTETCFFKYRIQFREDLETELCISIHEDFSINYIYGLPDSAHSGLEICRVMPRRTLWRIARKHGLRTGFARCRYHVGISDEGQVLITFHERWTSYNIDNYLLNAVTGEFLKHTKMNATF